MEMETIEEEYNALKLDHQNLIDSKEECMGRVKELEIQNKSLNSKKDQKQVETELQSYKLKCDQLSRQLITNKSCNVDVLHKIKQENEELQIKLLRTNKHIYS